MLDGLDLALYVNGGRSWDEDMSSGERNSDFRYVSAGLDVMLRY